MVPPMLWDPARECFARLSGRSIRFTGDFKTWKEAEAASTGYGSTEVLEQTILATRKVMKGEAAFERDGVTFDTMEQHFPLVWALMRAAAKMGRLHVLDFGGALGSTYFQSRALIGGVADLRWAVVEQPAHVAAGMQEFETRVLTFHGSIADARAVGECDVLLLSGVIQYLPDPAEFLEAMLSLRFPIVILDRTPFVSDGSTRLTVQHVPEWIYSASYPAWFFSEADVLDKFAGQYDTVASWPAVDTLHPEGGRARYQGFLFELKRT